MSLSNSLVVLDFINAISVAENLVILNFVLARTNLPLPSSTSALLFLSLIDL